MATTVLVIEKSPLNPVQFVPDGTGRPVSFNTVHQGQDYEINTLLRGQDKIGYAYNAQDTDILPFQFSYTYIGVQSLTIELMQPIHTPAGMQWESFTAWTPAATITSLLNNRVSVDGVSYQQYTAHFMLNLASLFNLSAGIYQLRLRVTYSSQNNGTYDRTHTEMSELIEVRKNHPGTILIQASNATNDYNTVFVQTGVLWGLRTEGALWGQTLDSDDVGYTNQSGQRKKLYGLPGEAMTLTIGGRRGVSKWLRSAVNYYMDCDYKAVDGLEITKDDSAKWEPIQASTTSYPLGGMSMSVRIADPTDRYKTVNRSYVLLFTIGAAPQYVVAAFVSKGGSNIVSLAGPLGSGYYTHDDASRKAMLEKMNRAAISRGLKGYVTLVGGEVRYYNGVGEKYDGSISKVLTKYMTFTVNDSAGAVNAIVTASYAGIVFDDANNKSIGLGLPVTNGATFTYKASGKARQMLIFHDDSITSLNVYGANISTYAGAMPVGIVDFSIHGTAIASFDFALFPPVSSTLASIDLHGNQIVSLEHTGLLGDGTILPPFSNLGVLNVASNKLNVASVNQFIDDVWLMVTNETSYANGFLSTQFQAPPAAPTGTTISHISDITINYGWTVNTD